LPEANFSQVPESPVNSGVDIQFTDLSSDPNNTPFISWFWEFGDGNDASEQNPVHVYTEPGEYPVMLVVINQFGCLDTIVKTVNVVDEVIIPNVFTPNGDGFNDFFEIKNIQFFGGNQVLIMNRWGRKVFEAADYNNDNIKWDGGDAPAGVYFYVVDVPDRDPQKGTVTLIRN
jgi:gliding motility-associated-like protein